MKIEPSTLEETLNYLDKKDITDKYNPLMASVRDLKLNLYLIQNIVIHRSVNPISNVVRKHVGKLFISPKSQETIEN